MAASASVIVYSLKFFSEGARGWPTGSQGVKGLAYRVPRDQGVGLQGPRGKGVGKEGPRRSRCRLRGSQEVRG